MSDEQPRGGKKQKGDRPQASEPDHTAHPGQPRPDSAGSAEQTRQPKEQKDGPASAPESGTREAPERP